ncbi:MAG: prephenate/arogenate dehydrogenase family protein [Robiginitomaculum sp.]|nr:prephenate/arogenate dehydrogenase family protein [Robiginitomaculum sp.]
MTHIFDTIFIIGGGLIGASMALASQAKRAANTVILTDKDSDVRAQLRDLKIGDEVYGFDDAKQNIGRADLVVLAVPSGAMVKALSDFLPHLKLGCLVSDVGSIKENIITGILPILPKGVEFIGGHPIAGTEKSGPAAGFASLFENRWCILTPQDETSNHAKCLKKFWQCLGSEVAFMDAKRHDLVLATTSHLPHLIAYALVGTATDMETVTRNEVVKYSAGGFRDFTRIAASDPVMWRDVFLGNRDAVLDVLGRYIEDLTALKKSIRWGDGEHLLKEFTKTRNIRERIIDAGQDSSAPNFGRDQKESDSEA